MTQKIIKSLLLICILLSAPAFSDTLKVAVAANFKATLEGLKPIFEQQSGHTLTIISSGTGHLTNQILNGAPFDVFLAANEQHPQRIFSKLKNKRNLTNTALQTYAHGRLVLLSNQPLSSSDLLTLLAGNEFSRLALANAKLAPYGLAAQQTLQTLNLKKQWQGKLVRGQNVAQVYQFIFTKNVQAGFVPFSMVNHQPSRHYIEVPKTFHQPIKQVALQLNNKKNSQEFMQFLVSPQARSIIKNMGYYLPQESSKQASQ